MPTMQLPVSEQLSLPSCLLRLLLRRHLPRPGPLTVHEERVVEAGGAGPPSLYPTRVLR